MIVEPDFARHIDVPGTGPCRRPVDIDRARTGFSDLVSLRVYAFDAGMVVNGEAEEDEVFVVLMRGRADMLVEMAGQTTLASALDADAGSRAIYLPPHAAYRLSAVEDCDVAYARVQPPRADTPPPRAFAPHDGALDVLDHAAGMTMTVMAMTAGDALASDAAAERFIHVRAENGGVAMTPDERLSDWQSAAIAAGEPAVITIEGDRVDVLTISASVD